MGLSVSNEIDDENVCYWSVLVGLVGQNHSTESCLGIFSKCLIGGQCLIGGCLGAGFHLNNFCISGKTKKRFCKLDAKYM